MAYFNYQGYSCYYEEKGEGRPLVFLHGNTASSNMFEDFSEKFEDRFKVIRIDFLGHGRSDRLKKFPADLWHDEAMQVIELIRQKEYEEVCLIGCSGGALVAINAALEAPNLICKVIADSFEGEKAFKPFTEHVVEDREMSKNDENTRMFYELMHGDDWESVVDNDTQAIALHDKTIGNFFQKPLNSLKADILLTGSKADEFICAVSDTYFQDVYGDMIGKFGHGRMYLFEAGGHPAMLSNPEEFILIASKFLEEPV